MEAARSFYLTAEFLAKPGVFGLIMAALTAALMSTVDTLITAVAAIAVNDIYGPSHPDVDDRQLLKVARYTSVGVTLFGVALVPLFASFDSIYSAHGAFTAAVTPPLVIALLFGVFWKRFTPTAARATMLGGSALILGSIFFPSLIAPFVHASPAPAELGDGLLAGMDQFKFMRAFYGLAVCAVIGVVVTLVTRPRPLEEVRGLVWGTVSDAIAHYKGSPGVEEESDWAQVQLEVGAEEPPGQAGLPVVHISSALSAAISAGAKDLLYVSDARAWLGGLRSAHAVIGSVEERQGLSVRMGAAMHAVVVAPGREGRVFRVKRLY
jgi:SSS family solute:Na+ symporter